MNRFCLLQFVLFFLITSIKAQNTEKVGERIKPFILGEIDSLYSAELSEGRTLNIYLPDGYNRNDTLRYPVIYLLDGSADEDFIHIVGLVQYFNFPWINTVPKSIVVGIANVDRRRDFTYPTTNVEDKKQFPTTGGSAKFIAFLEKELQPYIDNRFKTKGSNTIIGQSLGGLLVTQILFEKPELFSKYIIISPSLWWDDGSLLKQQAKVLIPSFSRQTTIYIGTGKEGFWPGKPNHIMEVEAKELADRFIKSGKKNLVVYYDFLPKETHATVTHPAVFNAFRMMYPAK